MESKLSEMSEWKRHVLSIVLISMLGIIAYSNTFGASFHFDTPV